jgi:hypothetical protein
MTFWRRASVEIRAYITMKHRQVMSSDAARIAPSFRGTGMLSID